MRTRTTIGLILLIVAIFGCDKDDKFSILKINGLSLYWHHSIFGAEGRELLFALTTTNKFHNDYDLEFKTSVIGNSINVGLIKSIDKGKCPVFPMPIIGDDDPDKCLASGIFHLSDKKLSNGIYSLNIIIPSFEVTSKLTVTDEKVTLEIPPNKFLSATIENVYPIPPNLLIGYISYQGSSNANDAENFLDNLTDLGLSQTTVPVHQYRYLQVDENGQLPAKHWEPDYHSIGILYKMNNTAFKTIFEKSLLYFNQTNLNFHLQSSNGDEAILSKTKGIRVYYAK